MSDREFSGESRSWYHEVIAIPHLGGGQTRANLRLFVYAANDDLSLPKGMVFGDGLLSFTLSYSLAQVSLLHSQRRSTIFSELFD